jgi:hypothetical protein
MKDTSNKHIMDTFTLDSIPDLDVCALGALELFLDAKLPMLTLGSHGRPLVVGSGNAAVTGMILYDERDAILTNESTYRHALNTFPIIAGAALISASGGKHAAGIAEHLQKRRIETRLFTTSTKAPAAEFIDNQDHVFVFPKNREPYTYNTSTYMGMLLAKTKERAGDILSFITKEVAPCIPDTLGSRDAFFFILPPRFILMHEMFITKFDELFGAHVSGRVFTLEQAKHAKTVVGSDSEIFVSFGEKNTLFGREDRRIFIPLPLDVDYAAMMAIGYYVIGHIQKQQHPYFKEHIKKYVEEASKVFEQDITAIVE